MAQCQVDVVSFNAAAAAAGRWKLAVSLLSCLQTRNLRATVVTFCAASNAAVSFGQWTFALVAFSAMQWRAIRSNAVVFGAACGAASSIKAWRFASQYLKQCRKVMQCNAIHFSHAVAASESHWEQATVVLQNMQDQHLSSTVTTNNALNLYAQTFPRTWARVLENLPNTSLRSLVSYGTAIVACETAGDWPGALWLCHALPQLTLRANEVIMGAVCSSSRSQWQISVGVLDHAWGLRLGNVLINSSVLSSCVKSRQWQMALGLGGHWQSDVVVGSACISAWEKGKDWSKALQILQQLRCNRLGLSCISYGAAISACEACEEWEVALLLLTNLRKDKLQPTVVTFNGVVQSCQKCSRWRETLQLLDQMLCSQAMAGLPNFSTFNAACCQSLAWEVVLSLFVQLAVVDAVSLNAAISAALLAGKKLHLDWCNQLQVQLAEKGMEALTMLPAAVQFGRKC
eukprot:Skav229938  [mRNA]  locus=scaffold4282:38408:39781:+ [translate_table: standard]